MATYTPVSDLVVYKPEEDKIYIMSPSACALKSTWDAIILGELENV